MKKPLSAKHQAKASTVHFVPKIFPITPTTHTATHTNTQAHTHTHTPQPSSYSCLWRVGKMVLKSAPHLRSPFLTIDSCLSIKFLSPKTFCFVV